MCGIAGIINKEGMDVSGKLIEMLSLIQHRGRDGQRIAVYGKGDEIFLRVAISKPDLHELAPESRHKLRRILSERLYESDGRVRYSEMKLDIDDEAIPVLHRAETASMACTPIPWAAVCCLQGKWSCSNLTGRHTSDYTPATHGIAHVRMATESAEDVNAAHPFISPFIRS